MLVEIGATWNSRVSRNLRSTSYSSAKPKPPWVCTHLERSTGRAVSKGEAIEIVKMSEKEGLVHVVDNRQAVGHVICNCCKDCCLNWTLMKKWVAPSRFEAVTDPDLCTGCETCLERCFFDAIAVRDSLAVVDPGKCMGCGVCTVSCPTEALQLKEVRPADFVPA